MDFSGAVEVMLTISTRHEAAIRETPSDPGCRVQASLYLRPTVLARIRHWDGIALPGGEINRYKYAIIHCRYKGANDNNGQRNPEVFRELTFVGVQTAPDVGSEE